MASKPDPFLPFVRVEPIDRTVGVGNGRFLGDVANGMSRADLTKRFREGQYPDLHPGLAQEALMVAGKGPTPTQEHP